MNLKDFSHEDQQLIQKAIDARAYAYAPYSGFTVGASIRLTSGAIFHGCNVENVSYGLCNCAERTAIFKAVSDLGKTIKLDTVVAVGSKGIEEPLVACSPCGACRQVIYEFSDAKTRIVYFGRDGFKEVLTSELLPDGFDF